MEYKCPNCGGELHFDPKIDKLKCDFCGNTYALSDFEVHDRSHRHDPLQNGHPSNDQDHEPIEVFDPDAVYGADALDEAPQKASEAGFNKATDDSTEIEEDLVVYSCPHCGAEVVTDNDTVATTCVFCGTPMVIDNQIKGQFKPKSVIPFAVDKKQIEDLYEAYIRNKPFYPPEYSKANVIEKIKAIYLPFWLFDVNMNGEIRASGEKTMTIPSGDWIITNHYVYDIDRAGSQWFHKVPVIGTTKTPKDAMDSIEPFDYSKMVPYNSGYLPGFMAQKYDRDSRQTAQFSKSRAENTFQNAMLSTINGYSGLHLTGSNIRPSSLDAQYALLPAYLLFMDYDNDEDKLIAINGQTGKIVGNVPVDAHKRNRYFVRWAILLTIIFLILVFGLVMIID
ncbi:zinc ribbon domain-containing protein [Erysipelotrichaceae bacterium RD49]|nr:zinc ribbon domain-containing protein [Erysipelotrichaceae bacterium RD49]